MRGEPSRDAEADHAAVALPRGRGGDLFEFAAGSAARDQDARSRGYARLESEPYECNDELSWGFDCCFADEKGFVASVDQSIYKGTPGEIQLGCHQKPLPRYNLARFTPPNVRLADFSASSGKSPSATVNSNTIPHHCYRVIRNFSIYSAACGLAAWCFTIELIGS